MSGFTKMIFALLFLMVVATPPSYGVYLGRRYVHIQNDLQNKGRLRIHCWSKDNDLGTKILNPNQETIWSFFDNYFVGTRFECNMSFLMEGRMKNASFVVYDNMHRIRLHECYKQCKWSVREYGLFAYNEVNKMWDFELPWPGTDSYGPSIAPSIKD